jgi:hypothetical protein
LSRRVTLPTADDLFRPTVEPDTGSSEDAPEQPRRASGQSSQQSTGRSTERRAVAAVPAPPAEEPSKRRSSGRVRHDEKMTVYVTAGELVDIEHARLTLRRDHGLAVDRGRLVREALAIVLADLDEHGDDSELVRRLIR